MKNHTFFLQCNQAAVDLGVDLKFLSTILKTVGCKCGGRIDRIEGSFPMSYKCLNDIIMSYFRIVADHKSRRKDERELDGYMRRLMEILKR